MMTETKRLMTMTLEEMHTETKARRLANFRRLADKAAHIDAERVRVYDDYLATGDASGIVAMERDRHAQGVAWSQAMGVERDETVPEDVSSMIASHRAMMGEPSPAPCKERARLIDSYRAMGG